MKPITFPNSPAALVRPRAKGHACLASLIQLYEHTCFTTVGKICNSGVRFRSLEVHYNFVGEIALEIAEKMVGYQDASHQKIGDQGILVNS